MFIKLTGYKRGSAVVLLLSSIAVIDRATDSDTNEECTAIYVSGVDGFFAVKETPEQIMEMIENARN